MTHDELLAKVDHNLDKEIWFQDMGYALRAVVELHKPSPEGRYDKTICTECSFTETGHYVIYPCRNIQAIEKELK